MLVINVFSLKFSTISLMLIAGVLSLLIYVVKNRVTRKGGETA